MTHEPTHPAPSIQEQYAPHSRCFGCGPANEKGLRIRSFASETTGEVTAEFVPEAHHEAFVGMVNGGIIGALLDCHSNWCAAYHLLRVGSLDTPPCTVTADFHVTLKRPTPSNTTLYLKAWVAQQDGNKVKVEATLTANNKICATCTGTFVAVTEGHPAYHRW
jgi:acyl-coenzyme A thioesterase PaaI-like protein